MLTEEEKELIDMCSEWGEEHRDLIRIISRLVKENEELQNFNEIKAGLSCAILQQEGYCELQSQLDAIKKAAQSILELIPSDIRRLDGVGDRNYVNAPVGLLKALDKLIGGGK